MALHYTHTPATPEQISAVYQHPVGYACDFYGNAGLYLDEEAPRDAPDPASGCRLVRLVDGQRVYAPTRVHKELFEAHLGTYDPAGDSWSGEITFRKFETPNLEMARDFSRLVEHRAISGPSSTLDDSSYLPYVPNTLFFWAYPTLKHVEEIMKAQGAGWRRFVFNTHQNNVAAREAEANRRVVAVPLPLPTPAPKQRRAPKPVTKEPPPRRVQPSPDPPLNTSVLMETLARVLEKHRHRRVGVDAKGRPTYSTGFRRKDGVWICPQGGHSIQAVLAPSVRCRVSVLSRDGNYRFGKHIFDNEDNR